MRYERSLAQNMVSGYRASRAFTSLYLAISCLAAGHYAQARTAAEQAMAIWQTQANPTAYFLAAPLLSVACRVLGEPGAAAEWLATARVNTPPGNLNNFYFFLAQAYTLVGDRAAALATLQEGAVYFQPAVWSRLSQDVAFARLQDDPAFQALVALHTGSPPNKGV